MPHALQFFERLAPATPHDTTSVRAALPSRFDMPSHAGSRGGGVLPDGPEEETVSEPAPRDAEPRAPADADVLPPRARPMNALANDIGAVSRAERRADVPDPVRAMTLLSPSAHASAPVAPRAAAADGRTVVPRRAPAERDDPPVVAAARITSSASLGDATRQPLREQVRAHRVVVSDDASPTIVHVTIERIDVRAPAARALPERAPAPPRHASWKSLDDYLRQRTQATGDGA